MRRLTLIAIALVLLAPAAIADQVLLPEAVGPPVLVESYLEPCDDVAARGDGLVEAAVTADQNEVHDGTQWRSTSAGADDENGDHGEDHEEVSARSGRCRSGS